MIKINFIRDSDRKDRLEKINNAINEYKEIWNKEGEKIVNSMEKISKLKFKENNINAIVFISSLSSRSFPLSLSANYPKERMPELIIHELCHRLLSGNKIRIDFNKGDDITLEIHKVLNLILYDIWEDLYGKEYADKSVEAESHKKAWKWALSFTKEERAQKFKELIKKSTAYYTQ